MAFLAVAMKDTALAANPLVVVPAIFKVPLGYLVTLVVVIGVFALRQFGDFAAYFAGATSYSTKSMSTLYEIFALRAVWCLVSVYLLTVSMAPWACFMSPTSKSSAGSTISVRSQKSALTRTPGWTMFPAN